jgi:hypothetical protein
MDPVSGSRSPSPSMTLDEGDDSPRPSREAARPARVLHLQRGDRKASGPLPHDVVPGQVVPHLADIPLGVPVAAAAVPAAFGAAGVALGPLPPGPQELDAERQRRRCERIGDTCHHAGNAVAVAGAVLTAAALTAPPVLPFGLCVLVGGIVLRGISQPFLHAADRHERQRDALRWQREQNGVAL